MKTVTFDNFPWWMVGACNAAGLAIYAIGLCLVAGVGVHWALLYAGYCLWLEWRLLSKSCRYCCYFGKRCAFGRGVICSWFFKKGVRDQSSAGQISWWDVAPDFLVSLIPLGVGIGALFCRFSWLRLLLVIALAGLATVGTGFIRSQLACKHCQQRELGCPAHQLFSKTKSA
jgi:hypothetical protein